MTLQMGAWGTAIFSDDAAMDARDGFRDLIGTGVQVEEATDRVIAWSRLKPPGDPYGGAGWLGLAVTQWKLGCLIDRVRDLALAAIDVELASPIFEGKDVAKREGVLVRTREQLTSPLPPRKKVPAKRVPKTPFNPGDMLRFTTNAGREVAIWILQNEVREEIVGTTSNSFFRVWAIGDPKLPPFEELVASGPFVKSTVKLGESNSYRTWVQGSFDYPQDAVGPQWSVIDNARYAPPPGGDDDIRDRSNFVRAVRPSKREGSLDDVFERMHASQQVVDPLVAPVQKLCNIVPGLPGFRDAWQGRALDQAALVAVACAQGLERGEKAQVAPTFAMINELIAGEPYDREVGREVLGALLNLATHSAVRFDRGDLEASLDVAALTELRALDAAWGAAASRTRVHIQAEPVEHLRGRPDRDQFWWTTRARIRATPNGTYLAR